MEIKKGNIAFKECGVRVASNNLVSKDVIVPDTKPDIAEILLADATSKVTDIDYKNGKLNILGCVTFTALYKPEEGGKLKSLEESFDFSQGFDVKANEETEFSARCVVEHINFTQVNSRKIAAKVMLKISAVGCEEKSYEPVIQVSGDDMESRSKKHSIYIPMSETKTDITVSDILTVPDEKADIGEILKVDAWANTAETKAINGKVMVYGNLNVSCIYVAADEEGGVDGVSYTVPFTEIVEAPGADEQSVVNVKLDVESISAAGKGDLNGDTKILSIDSKIIATAKVSKTVSESFVDDCFCLSQNTCISRESMDFCEYVASENSRITTHQTVEAPNGEKISRVVSCTAKPILKEISCDGGKAKVKGTLVSFLVFYDGEDDLQCAVTESDIEWERMVGADCSIEADLRLEGVVADIVDKKAQILANTGLFMKALKSHKVDIITDCSQKEWEEMPKYPSLVVYFAKEGDSVWSIAKKYKTKCEKIMSINGLDSEKIEKGKRLLIPKA